MNPNQLHALADLFADLAKEMRRNEASLRHAAHQLQCVVFDEPSARETRDEPGAERPARAGEEPNQEPHERQVEADRSRHGG